VSLDELAFCSLKEIRDLLSRREISARELVESHLSRIEDMEPKLNAFITVTSEGAIRSAIARDEAAARGDDLGCLHGVPLTLKDLLWTRGVRTTSGSKIFSDFVPSQDATVVARLRASGAIFLGKTNLHEFAYGVSSVNPHYGPVRNPWDVSRIAGGSSGGSAAALAAGIGYGSMGTDTGGSIRIPSALCGTVGFKPTYGRISRFGATPLAWTLDHVGPMTRTVADAAALYEATAGYDDADPTSSGREVDNVSEHLDEPPASLKVGLPREYFLEGNDPEVDALFQGAVKSLETLGMAPVQVSIPEVRHQFVCRNVISFAEATSYHEPNLRERPHDYGENTRDLLRLGLTIRATEYLSAQRARRRIVEAFKKAFQSIDVLVCPSSPAPAPRIEATSLSNGEELRAGLLRLTSPFNTVGFPAISVPCGYTSSGLPASLQIVARPFEESLLLKVAHAYECAHRWGDRRPDI
jgi:aspartyl-tRNA(Asn)/glutamyl-tRNA(Gln) amidotransferase subunit A